MHKYVSFFLKTFSQTLSGEAQNDHGGRCKVVRGSSTKRKVVSFPTITLCVLGVLKLSRTCRDSRPGGAARRSVE